MSSIIQLEEPFKSLYRKGYLQLFPNGRKYILLLLPFIFFLASCGKKQDAEELKSYIERITSEDVSCYRVVTEGLFGYSKGDWRCSTGRIYFK